MAFRWAYAPAMELANRVGDQVAELVALDRDWISFATAATDLLAKQIEFDPQLLALGRSGHGDVHRQPQPERRVFRNVAG